MCLGGEFSPYLVERTDRQRDLTVGGPRVHLIRRENGRGEALSRYDVAWCVCVWSGRLY